MDVANFNILFQVAYKGNLDRASLINSLKDLFSNIAELDDTLLSRLYNAIDDEVVDYEFTVLDN